MTSVAVVDSKAHQAEARSRLAQRPADNVKLDWWIAIIGSLTITGLFIDGWAHNHDRVDNTFFTPWHGMLYGAYAISAVSLLVVHYRNVSRGYHWKRALPRGYMASLVGALAFALAGMGDMLWHEAFGFEEDLESLLSPTHLLLAVSGLLITTGPIRALWHRRGDHSWRSLLPALMAITALTSVFTFFMTFAAVTSRMDSLTGARPVDHTLTDVYGIMSLVVHSNILLSTVLFFSRRWRLPFGSATLIFSVNAVAMTWLHVDAAAEFMFVINAAVAGLLTDALLSAPANDATQRMRLLSCVLPFVFSLGALLTLHILGQTAWGQGGLWWEIHMWLGVPILAGAFGYGLSLLMVPPAMPAASH